MENRGFLYSFIAHLVIVLTMVIRVVFYPSEALDLSQAIRVDMIDLPDKIVSQELPEEKSPVAPPKEKEEIKEKKPDPKALPEKKVKPQEDTINVNKAKSKQKEALNKLKALSAIEKLKKEIDDEKIQEPPPTKQVFKGRILSAGTALAGLDKLQSDSYLSQLDGRIKAHWSLPQWLIGKSLRTRVHIKFDESGNIIYKRVVQSSGNPTYDEYCMLALDKAAPFPRAPEKFSAVYKIDGVTIGFPD